MNWLRKQHSTSCKDRVLDWGINNSVFGISSIFFIKGECFFLLKPWYICNQRTKSIYIRRRWRGWGTNPPKLVIEPLKISMRKKPSELFNLKLIKISSKYIFLTIKLTQISSHIIVVKLKIKNCLKNSAMILWNTKKYRYANTKF